MDPSVVDHLYALPAGEFVAARNALAKELKAAGDKEAGAAVAKLRRPTSTAWALNQVARGQADLLDAALGAKADLRAATEGTGRGEDVDLRAATTADREATRAVIAAARALLGGEDAGLASRITDTLLAAVLDDRIAGVVRSGCLSAEQDASGFSLADGDGGDLAPVIVLADRAARKAAKPDADAKAAAEAERARRRARADQEREVERLEQKAKRADEKATEAEELAARLRGDAETATAAAAEARAELDDA